MAVPPEIAAAAPTPKALLPCPDCGAMVVQLTRHKKESCKKSDGRGRPPHQRQQEQQHPPVPQPR